MVKPSSVNDLCTCIAIAAAVKLFIISTCLGRVKLWMSSTHEMHRQIIVSRYVLLDISYYKIHIKYIPKLSLRVILPFYDGWAIPLVEQKVPQKLWYRYASGTLAYFPAGSFRPTGGSLEHFSFLFFISRFAAVTSVRTLW